MVRFHGVKIEDLIIKSVENKIHTTGFTPILLHSFYHTTTLMNKFQVLVVLVVEGVTLDDLLEQINFWMPDCPSDNIVLNNLGVDKERRLKCTAHIALDINML